MDKIKNIEFLRIIGCLAIILLHLFCNNCLHGLFGDIGIYNKLFGMTSNGQKAVDLFFMLSGFFALLLGVFTYHFVEVPCAKYLKEKFQIPYPERVSGGPLKPYLTSVLAHIYFATAKTYNRLNSEKRKLTYILPPDIIPLGHRWLSFSIKKSDPLRIGLFIFFRTCF